MRQPQPELIDATELIAWLRAGIEEIEETGMSRSPVIGILKDIVKHIQEEVAKSHLVLC